MHKDISLIVFEGRKTNFYAADLVFNYMKSLGGWGQAVIIKQELTYSDAMLFEFGEYLNYINKNTTHVLIATWDGFCINPHLWDDNWLQYDMIGAPWEIGVNSWKHRVGNTGFCLQSKKFLQIAQKHKNKYKGGPADVFLCQTMHDTFVEEGIKYAPLDVALKFSWEHNMPEGVSGPDTSFGFHGWHCGRNQNWYYYHYLQNKL
jgi:hypothetical protein